MLWAESGQVGEANEESTIRRTEEQPKIGSPKNEEGGTKN
jgi:hypothetical protein